LLARHGVIGVGRDCRDALEMCCLSNTKPSSPACWSVGADWRGPSNRVVAHGDYGVALDADTEADRVLA